MAFLLFAFVRPSVYVLNDLVDLTDDQTGPTAHHATRTRAVLRTGSGRFVKSGLCAASMPVLLLLFLAACLRCAAGHVLALPFRSLYRVCLAAFTMDLRSFIRLVKQR